MQKQHHKAPKHTTTFMSFIIRPATEHDLPAIQNIYNAEVLQGMATWNEHAYDLNHFKHQLQHFQHNQFPFCVIEDPENHVVAGFADYASFRNFSGYRYTVEHSLYIAPNYARRGLGKQLLAHLIEHAKGRHMHVMIAGIDHANLASIALHKQFGFVQTGYMPQVGQKFGQWRDLVLMQLMLNQ